MRLLLCFYNFIGYKIQEYVSFFCSLITLSVENQKKQETHFIVLSLIATTSKDWDAVLTAKDVFKLQFYNTATGCESRKPWTENRNLNTTLTGLELLKDIFSI